MRVGSACDALSSATLRRAAVAAQLAIDVREQLVRLGLRGAVAGRLGGAQLGERECGDRLGLAQLRRDAHERHRRERIAGPHLERVLIQPERRGAVVARSRLVGIAHDARELVGAGAHRRRRFAHADRDRTHRRRDGARR